MFAVKRHGYASTAQGVREIRRQKYTEKSNDSYNEHYAKVKVTSFNKDLQLSSINQKDRTSISEIKRRPKEPGTSQQESSQIQLPKFVPNL